MAKDNEQEQNVFFCSGQAYDSSVALSGNAFSDPVYYTLKITGIIGEDRYHVWFSGNEEYGFTERSDLWHGNG